MNSFVYFTNRYILINGRKFTENVLRQLHPDIEVGNAKVITYDGKSHTRHDGVNQWGGPVPWEEGNQILLRFHDLCMVEKYLEEQKNK